ncbi:TPA: hypothetical protein DEO28_01350 [Candidatus Dependentiae bacterium]|nr:MAG: hypothetical protein UR14_C0003G0118 [candidate division TM6 bacterium GW2011_GWE2_31_21]KKP53718.1 MAG: hypothetical protein UR43_C0003G0039 [candidate division TM6 bacterium GW2011_GWF2_33_332]HBS48530.1 hypothetical protein [Candidatus Dependentiae bacterium]HBZ73145.1 hypothetical protein [Candidatus Dependentiae bacterium]
MFYYIYSELKQGFKLASQSLEMSLKNWKKVTTFNMALIFAFLVVVAIFFLFFKVLSFVIDIEKIEFILSGIILLICIVYFVAELIFSKKLDDGEKNFSTLDVFELTIKLCKNKEFWKLMLIMILVILSSAGLHILMQNTSVIFPRFLLFTLIITVLFFLIINFFALNFIANYSFPYKKSLVRGCIAFKKNLIKFLGILSFVFVFLFCLIFLGTILFTLGSLLVPSGKDLVKMLAFSLIPIAAIFLFVISFIILGAKYILVIKICKSVDTE